MYWITDPIISFYFTLKKKREKVRKFGCFFILMYWITGTIRSLDFTLSRIREHLSNIELIKGKIEHPRSI